MATTWGSLQCIKSGAGVPACRTGIRGLDVYDNDVSVTDFFVGIRNHTGSETAFEPAADNVFQSNTYLGDIGEERFHGRFEDPANDDWQTIGQDQDATFLEPARPGSPSSDAVPFRAGALWASIARFGRGLHPT